MVCMAYLVMALSMKRMRHHARLAFACAIDRWNLEKCPPNRENMKRPTTACHIGNASFAMRTTRCSLLVILFQCFLAVGAGEMEQDVCLAKLFCIRSRRKNLRAARMRPLTAPRRPCRNKKAAVPNTRPATLPAQAASAPRNEDAMKNGRHMPPVHALLLA
jgi:hypothetical protein